MGGVSADTIAGGACQDDMTGGAGQDLFILRAGEVRAISSATWAARATTRCASKALLPRRRWSMPVADLWRVGGETFQVLGVMAPEQIDHVFA